MLQIIKGLSLFKLPYLRTQPRGKDTKNKPIQKKRYNINLLPSRATIFKPL